MCKMTKMGPKKWLRLENWSLIMSFSPGFPGISRWEMGHFSRFPAGNSKPGKCATLACAILHVEISIRSQEAKK